MRLSFRNIISHPDRSATNRSRGDRHAGDRLLVGHLRGVKNRCTNGADSQQRYYEIIGGTHDLGKATTYFQAYIRGLEPSSQKTSHAPISGLACYRALRNDGFSRQQSFAGLLAVDAHHSQLGNVSGTGSWFERVLSDSRQEVLQAQAAALKSHSNAIQPICDELRIPLRIEDFADWVSEKDYLREFLRYLYENGQLKLETDCETACGVIEAFARLVAADKLDAAQYEPACRHAIPREAVDAYIQREFGSPEAGSIDELREQARTDVRTTAQKTDISNTLFELTLPTGLGKTLTSLDAALILRDRIEAERGQRPRIVYTVPYTSIIDQNFTVFESVLANTTDTQVDASLLLKHHYLSDSTYVTGEARDPDQDAERAVMMTERWESEFIATTFVQFFESLVVPSNSQSMKIPNLENAIVLMDEVQAIPARYWDVVREVLDILSDRLGCTFIAMSATQPGLFEKSVSLVDDSTDRAESSTNNQYFADLDRVSFQFDQSINGPSLTHSDLAEQVLDHAASNPADDLLTVCNTIESATELFENIRNQGVDNKTSLVYLSSAVRPKDRRQRIERLRTSSQERFIVISTQVVEAGVDISMDRVWRDFAPLDSIVQAAGRCNREWDGDSKGVVTVVSLTADGEAPANAIYDAPRLDATRRTIESATALPSEVPEYEVTSTFVDQYFDIVEEVKDTGDSFAELQSWQFDNAEISLIEDVYSADVFVATEAEQTDSQKPTAFRRMRDAVKEGSSAAIAQAKPEFYDNVVSVNLYSESSTRADRIQSLPLPDTDLGVYFVNADSQRYGNWYDEETGFRIPENTVDARLI